MSSSHRANTWPNAFSPTGWWSKNGDFPHRENRRQTEVKPVEANGRAMMLENAILTGAQDLRENCSSSGSFVHRAAKVVKNDNQEQIWSVAFLADGKHVVSGGSKGKIRHWRLEDGEEVGTPMDARSGIRNIAVSQDGKRVVSGTDSGLVAVWNTENHDKVNEFQAHMDLVRAVDVSQDGTRIVTGSADKTACIWSFSSGDLLLGPLQHDNVVVATKFSPDGRLIATATLARDCIRIYDILNDLPLLDVPIQVNSLLNQSLAWDKEGTQLFALSHDANIYCLDVLSRTVFSRAPIHSSNDPTCIVLASNGSFIAASAHSSISFWDTTTRTKIGPTIEHTDLVLSMAISANHDIVIGGGNTITFCDLSECFHSPYSNLMLLEREVSRMNIETIRLGERIESLRCRDERSVEQLANLEKTAEGLRRNLARSRRTAAKKMNNLDKAARKISHFEQTMQGLRNELAFSLCKADGLTEIVRAHEQKHHCQVLYAEGHTIDAAMSLLKMTNTVTEGIRGNALIMDWLAEFTNRCISALDTEGEIASRAGKHEEALAALSTALSLSLSTPNTLLDRWASIAMSCRSPKEALSLAIEFKLPRFDVYQTVCDVLEREGRVMEAIESFIRMHNELGKATNTQEARVQWELDFQCRCAERLEKRGDAAMDSQEYDEATRHFSAILSLDKVDCTKILSKRSKARALLGSWKEALSDADKIIKFDPSSHRGYERRYEALRGMGCHGEAFEAFEIMVSKLKQSPETHIRGLLNQYVDVTSAIRKVIEQVMRDMPRVLINTSTGHLHNKAQQQAAFETLPVYNELRSSMTIRLDYARIRKEVKDFYRYVTLSHRWEDGELPFKAVKHVSIYGLGASSANDKLREFCELVRSLGFRWAWSDTCCIDKDDIVVLRESLVAMFKWYRGSSLTIVYLYDVLSQHQEPGALQKSIWNTRVWTYQEYVAAEVIQFYTKDWKPYLDLTMFNHKDCPAIIEEMQQVTGIPTRELAVLYPGLDRVREKLSLASRRQTTLVEDTAYSLFGIFNISIPVIYGEGYHAVGRLLEYVLTGSRDVTILAWTGRAGDYNSCLPIDLTVYDEPAPPHVPQSIKQAEMNSLTMALHSSLDHALAKTLHKHLKHLPLPSLSANRLHLPGIVFRLAEIVQASRPGPASNLHVYHATTPTFGHVEIKTADNLIGSKDLCLFHPWIRPLLDQEHLEGADVLDKVTQALRLVVRLRQPFGALLFQRLSRVEYERVATDCLITVKIHEDVSLTELIDNICTIDVR